MINEQEVLKIVTKRLESAGIRYMVTGSIAANFYTTSRMTRDIDIIIEVKERDVERLFSLFSNDFYAKDSLSEMQIRDVKNVLKTVPDLDTRYIEKWVAKLKLKGIYQEAKRGE